MGLGLGLQLRLGLGLELGLELELEYERCLLGAPVAGVAALEPLDEGEGLADAAARLHRGQMMG